MRAARVVGNLIEHGSSR